MSAVTTPKPVRYPDSDGQPMADNTVQFEWIATLKWNADAYLRDRPDVFVAGDHLIYPEEGSPAVRQAPDVYVAFGRPRGDRGSYKVWEEAGVFPQVVFEVWSPANRFDQMQKKFEFYERYGAEEYYILYPEFPAHVEAWRRDGDRLTRIAEVNGYRSPRLGFRFVLVQGDLTVFGPDGRPLRNPTEMARERDEAEARLAAERERTEVERRRAEVERQRAERLAAKLRELGLDPDQM